MLSERFVRRSKPEIVEVELGKHGHGSRVAFVEGVDLPKECHGVAKAFQLRCVEEP